MRRALVAFAALFAMAYPAFPADQALKDQVFTPSVQLGKFCSGEIISSKREEKSGLVATIVLTAKHCVKDQPTQVVPVEFYAFDKELKPTGSTVYLADVLGMSYKSDLALLRLRDKDKLFEKVAEVAPKDVKLEFAQDVVLIGFPMGLGQTFTRGNLGFQEMVEDFSDISQSRLFLRATPDVAPGSSGSSMFVQDGGKWKIIGVTTGMMRAGNFMNFFTAPGEINDYLDTAKTSFAWDSSGTAVGSPSTYSGVH